MRNVLIVFIGGGVGSVCRYGVGRGLTERVVSAWPLGTLCVNVLGCLLIGLIVALAERCRFGPSFTLLCATGFCGGFTTFSTFALEQKQLLDGSRVWIALTYVGLSVALGLGACALGLACGRALRGS